MATLGGAEALGMDAQIGSLESGKKADFFVIDLEAISTIPVDDPETSLIFSASARDVIASVVDGRFLYDRGEVKTIDEARTRADMHSITKKLS
jgi:5-methylthioadenosine/S-adenosylhomocysteine deaminase